MSKSARYLQLAESILVLALVLAGMLLPFGIWLTCRHTQGIAVLCIFLVLCFWSPGLQIGWLMYKKRRLPRLAAGPSFFIGGKTYSSYRRD